MKLGYIRRVILFTFSVVLLSHSIVFGRILDKWSNSDAYKPTPILFLHGFAFGNPGSWNYIKSQLNQYFNDYSSTFTFLETINFNDPNGSVDTYPDGRVGWADKVRARVDELLNIYRFKGQPLPINFVCHSMGGLAAREYLTNPKYGNSYQNIDKLITIATPHAGSPFANIKKIEYATTGIHKYIWEIPTNERVGIKINDVQMTDNVLQLLKDEFQLDPEGEAVKDMAVRSEFLMNLNSRNQPAGFKNYALYGETWHFLNPLFSAYYPSEPWTCGDGIVPRDSQIGIDIMTNYPDTTPKKVWSFDGIAKIPKDHFAELNYEETPRKILSFFDSAKPVLEITYPGSGTTKIYERSIHIQGKVYKEYLPADSQLIINIRSQEDGYTLPTQTSLLKPSDLWIPNNSDSPVAEFDEVVNFPGKGTYKISCQIKNPAGIVSDIKNVWVKIEETAKGLKIYITNSNNLYIVYGGNFGPVGNDDFDLVWKIVESPETYGYKNLGSATSTKEFYGGYVWYLVKGVNVNIDAFELLGTSQFWWGKTGLTWYTSGFYNSGNTDSQIPDYCFGPPDGKYASLSGFSLMPGVDWAK